MGSCGFAIAMIIVAIVAVAASGSVSDARKVGGAPSFMETNHPGYDQMSEPLDKK